ncbi:MAG: leucine-rich repeat domain-containing protein, partial [Ureaplasma sp.]|nr:leucine-rich repeat domain-containing protein [Ureaplasma sp.]
RRQRQMFIIDSYIIDNDVTETNLNSNINNIRNLIDATQTSNNQNLGNYISNWNYSNNSITISLNNMVKISPNSFTNISINWNNILITNIALSSTDLFIWSGSQITGITDKGRQNEMFIFPSKTTSIASGLFKNNTNIKSFDMSRTKITSIGESTFQGCSNLKDIILPNTLTKVYSYAFLNCVNLNSFTLPKSISFDTSHTHSNRKNFPIMRACFYNTGNQPIYIYASSIRNYIDAWTIFYNAVNINNPSTYEVTYQPPRFNVLK